MQSPPLWADLFISCELHGLVPYAVGSRNKYHHTALDVLDGIFGHTDFRAALNGPDFSDCRVEFFGCAG